MTTYDPSPDINLLAAYLAPVDIADFSSRPAIDAIVVCASELLVQAESLFQTLTLIPSLARALVLCGGIGHSTDRIHDAIKRHPRFHEIADQAKDLPEARVLEMILRRYFDPAPITSEGCQVLIEDQSTNCGANATRSKAVLDAIGLTLPRRIVIVQDPTMALRTVASFAKAYEGSHISVELLSCPVVVPRVRLSSTGLVFCVAGLTDSELWDMDRFLDLIMGEVPRLKDDEDGYGPKGRGYIPHVDLPAVVEEAWRRLSVARESSPGPRLRLRLRIDRSLEM